MCLILVLPRIRLTTDVSTGHHTTHHLRIYSSLCTCFQEPGTICMLSYAAWRIAPTRLRERRRGVKNRCPATRLTKKWRRPIPVRLVPLSWRVRSVKFVALSLMDVAGRDGPAKPLTAASYGDKGGTLRVLIADDFPDFRRFICTTIAERLDWRVIGGVTDGLEAVQRAAELKPDLIVLDIGLPKLNGIDAARQIRQLSPGTKIVFLSQNSDPDVVQAALSTGAEGYHSSKAYAQSDLLSGIETVLRGERFVRAA